MRIDLERALADVAATVHDDVTAERMSGQVRHMVARVRRRRAVRHTAQGVASVGAVAVIGVAATSLGGGPQVGPAPGVPTGQSSPGGFGACGSTVVDPDPGADPAVGLDGSVTASDDGVARVLVRPGFVGEDPGLNDPASSSFEDPVAVATLDGVVVTPVAELVAVEDSWPQGYSLELPAVACEDGSALPDGQYEVYALQRMTLSDGAGLEVLGGPWPLTLPGGDEVTTPDPDEPVTDGAPEAPTAPAGAQEQIDAWLADPEETDGPFPVCGTQPWLDDGMPALELDYVAGTSDLVSPGGATVPGGVVLKTTEGRYAIANASPLARVVLLRDGVVVGVPFLDPEDVVDVDLAFGQTQAFDLRTTTALCGAGEGGTGESLPLPAGEYTAIAALDLMVKEIGGPGEEPDGSTYAYTALSEPVTIRLP